MRRYKLEGTERIEAVQRGEVQEQRQKCAQICDGNKRIIKNPESVKADSPLHFVVNNFCAKNAVLQ